ncbi:AMP-binding protein [Chryseobacterium hagamense]|uniref:O-succinylbenzoic acid--CoA ligase n=1 Tax=Chryseobacterium hagamense TaxID=395935 RepID=A0A511YLC6_9FLAO|nr:AMP-binding protein [Chryseobacterium hagamense]GEN75980.1 O-succinylbenzoic acid--CoA ligase [Chryseobacterium hagamense]
MLIDFKNLNLNQLSFQSEFEIKIRNFLDEWFSDSKTVKVQTSGSTGTPKIFEIEKKKMINSAEMTCNFLGLKEGDTALICLPVEYISGKMMVVRSVEKKLKLIIADPSVKPLEQLNQKVDFCAMTPLQAENSLDQLHLIKNLIIGGAAVSESLKNKILQTLAESGASARIFETYGMSETLSHIALKQIAPQAEDYFKTFENVEISRDERGCLKIFAPSVNSEILQTNDLVKIKNGNQFRFLGRVDNVINSGGAKIFPEQLEALVKKEIGNEAVFLGIDDESLGQKLTLVIEGNSSEELKQKLSTVGYHEKFHKPKEIIYIEKIPRTPNGKVDRIKLKKTLNHKN